MVLVDWQIRNLCNHGLLFPFDEDLINPASIDIRVGKTALIDTEEGFIDYPDFESYTVDNPYLLRPNECLMVATLEYLKFPPFICADLKLKSSRAREGLSHSLAGWIDNGFHGIVTMELKNFSTKRDVKIYPNLRIGQLVIHNTDTPQKDYSHGRYAGHNKVLGSLDV